MASNSIVTVATLAKNNEKIKEQLATKVNIEQGVDNKGKLLGIDDNGKVIVVDKPESVKISAETGNIITQKTDGLFAEDTIVEIQVDGTPLAITDKKVNFTGFITKAVNDLENYYLKTETYNKEEVDNLLKAVSTLKISKVDTLPTTDISTTVIYLLPKTDTDEKNIYAEYINLDGTENGWECIGDTKVDLTEYAKTTEVEKLIENAVYTTTTTEAHYEITESTTDNALEVVADGTATDGQIDISSVTPLLDGVTVSEGDYVVWIEAVTTKDAKFLVEADLDPYVAEEEIKVMTEEELLEKLGLSEEELQGLTQLISDTEVRIDKTYSSSKIYNELNRILEEGKTYTLAEIAKSSGASYKIASSTTEMTSTKYIYLLANGDTYDMYICEEENSVPVKIGTTSVTLTDYYTKTECDERYVLATAFELLNNSIGNINNLQTTSKVIVDAINEVVISVDGMSTTVTETKDALGDITALETEAKDNVVNAVNEVKQSIDEFETYVELTQEEYDALADDEIGKLNGTEYRTTDTGRIYKNGVQYGGQEPEVIEGFAKYKEMKEAGLIDPDTEYIVTSDENEILLNGNDVGYNNAESGIQATTVQGAIDKVNDKVDNLIDDEVSDSTVWSSKKTSDEIAKKESVYITDSIANTLYYACEYFGLDCRNQYQVLEIEVIDAKGQNLKFNSIYKHEVLHHAQVISENGITLKAIDNIGTLAFENASDYTIKVKHIDICPDSIGDTLVTVINRANKNALVSDIGAKVTKTLYRGSRSIDIYTGGKLTFIYSSEYASQAGCYMLLSNFNTVPLLIELGRNDIGQFKVTATHKSENVDTITVTTAGDEYSWYVLQF